MSTSDFRHAMLTKWQTHRATVDRHWQNVVPQVTELHKHLAELSQILEEAIQRPVEFKFSDPLYTSEDGYIAQKLILECSTLNLTWTKTISFGGSGLLFEGTPYSYEVMHNIKIYINMSVVRSFIPPSQTIL